MTAKKPVAEEDKRVLGLELPTDPRWAHAAQMQIGDILTDHAWCEQKAATTCISLIVQYNQNTELVRRLSPVVTEEWGHFRMVLRELEKRNLPLGQQRKDEYVNQLLAMQRKSGHKNELLAEKLLTAALIEARSCERFRLLSHHISDHSLRGFYHDLMVAEAQHYRMFVELACTAMPENYVMKRWKEWLQGEAEIMKDLVPRPDRMH